MAINLTTYSFIAWVGIPTSLHLDDLERALRAFFPGLSLASSDQDEVEMWRFEGNGIVVEIQRPVCNESGDHDDAELNFVCMVCGRGKKPLEDASIVVAQHLTDATGVECKPLGNQ
jgi:hypothetical protein